MPSIGFSIHGARLAIGGVLLAVGGGLGGFSTELKDTATAVAAIVGAVLFAVGVVVTASGLMKISRNGVIVHKRWSQDRILDALKAAPDDAVVKILQTWIPEEDFTDHLGHLYREGRKRFELQVMLMDPAPHGDHDLLASRVRLRGWISRAKAADNIVGSAERLIGLRDQLESDGKGGRGTGHAPRIDLEIRLYDFLPFGPIYKIGEEIMFAGFYLNHTTSTYGPMLEVSRDSAPKVWHDFDENLRAGWEMATPYPPLNADQPHA